MHTPIFILQDIIQAPTDEEEQLYVASDSLQLFQSLPNDVAKNYGDTHSVMWNEEFLNEKSGTGKLNPLSRYKC
jgi:hypothetical protein